MQLLQKRSDRNRVVEKSEPKPRENRKLIVGALAGFAGVCVVQLLGVTRPDLSLQVALYAFALSIPLLIRDLLDVQVEDRHGITINLDKRLNATTTGIAASIAGVAAIFCHFSPWMCSLFLASTLWCMWSHSSYFDSLSEEAERQAKDEPEGPKVYCHKTAATATCARPLGVLADVPLRPVPSELPTGGTAA